MSGLPKQVQQQLEEAQRIQDSMAQPTPPDPAPQIDPPPVDPDPAPAEPAPAPEPAAPGKDAAYWEHRYKTLEGISKAERQRVEQQIQLQSEQLRQATAMLESVRQQPAPQPQPEKPLVTSQDEDKFGSDLIDAMRRVSKEEFRNIAAEIAGLRETIRKLTPQVERVGRVEAEVAQSREERFWTELDAAVPDWQKINTDQRWVDWLQEYDPVAGCTRQKSLEAAQLALDQRRVIGLFKLFKPASPQQRQPNSELARQVAPSRTSTVTVPPVAEKRYTGQEYAYWLDPRRMNDTPAEQAKAMKAEVDRAYEEGRIQW